MSGNRLRGSIRSRIHLLRRAFALSAALVLLSPAEAAQEVPADLLVRAAMVFNFLKFTDFPAGSLAPNADIHLCVAVGDKRQAEAFAALAGRRIGNHKLSVTDIETKTNGCNVLYVDSRQRWSEIDAHNALSISSYPGFAREEGMIEIVVRNDGTTFDINLVESRRAGFHFAPQLLRLARQIYD